MRKYQQYREDAQQLTVSLCMLLAVAVVGTIVVSAIALAAVGVFSTRAYLAAAVRIEMPAGYWTGVYFARLGESALFMTLVVLGTAIYRSWQLSEEGGRLVARLVGGTRVHSDTSDPSHRKLLNVVEELAIAAGLRVPTLFVLEGETGVNAFAAGYQDRDTVIGVTRGAIDKLTRQQLQGIMAHEYSHIANSDVKLNIRLIGIMAGMQAVSFIAAFLIRLGLPRREDRGGITGGRHPLGMILAFVFGAVLWPIGQIGTLFASIVKFALNRQREFLADASAVQFTRDPNGLREALEVLQDEHLGSRVNSQGAQTMSHLFFADVSGKLSPLLETHPPLAERIRRLETSEIAFPSASPKTGCTQQDSNLQAAAP